jgi:F0F1-type ATP synthase assembly protein I
MKPLLFKIRSARAPYAQRASSSDLFGRGMDLALAMLVFVLLGWAIDNWLGTKPLFIIVFAALAMIGGGARLKYSYDEAMRRHERERAEAVRAARTSHNLPSDNVRSPQ